MNPARTIADQAEAALRLFFAESREDADRLLNMYGPLVRMFEQDLDAAVEVRHLVLSRFAPAEPPSVPGLDWLRENDCPSMFQDRSEPIYLYPCRNGKGHEGRHHSRDHLHSWTNTEQYDPSSPAVEADAAVLVAETVAALDKPKPRRWQDRDGQFWQVGEDDLIALETERGPSRLFVLATEQELAELYGPLVEVVPQPEVLTGEVTSPFGPCSGLALDRRDNTCTRFAAEYVESVDDVYGTLLRRLCTPCADLVPVTVSRRPLTTDANGYPVERAR